MAKRLYKMKIDFQNLINKEHGKSAFVVGMGPSLGNHIDKISELSKNDNYVLISCNDVDIHTNLNPHYWVWANSEDNIGRIYQRLNSKNSTLIYADSVDLTERSKVEELLSINYVSYDERHHNDQKCGNGKCCDHMIPGRLTIQEELKKYTNFNERYTNIGTIAIHMLSVAILLGCKNIFVTGVDLDYSKGYFGGKKGDQARNFHSCRESFTNNLKTILDTIALINNSAKNIGTNIYCLDKDLPISTILEHSIIK